jgi:nucleoside phosphorylase
MAHTSSSAGGGPRSLPPEKYTVGWICAIPTELIAAKAMLDEVHGMLKDQPKHDGNSYTLGSIGEHNIVLACLPRYGTNDAAVAGISMQRTFSNLRFGLMVGVGGGIPSAENDIRLGDIAVSVPSGQASGVIQYDMGKKDDGEFRRTGSLNNPPTLLLAAIANLRATRNLGKEITAVINEEFPDHDDDNDEGWRFPTNAPDILYEESDELSNGNSKDERIVARQPRKSRDPKCFYGNIGSGNSVIKNAKERRLLASDGNLICFEMEAAGLMNFFKCVVIRGICDYADKHKHKIWQPYAAAVAAAYAKKLLAVIGAEAVESLEPIKSK